MRTILVRLLYIVMAVTAGAKASWAQRLGPVTLRELVLTGSACPKRDTLQLDVTEQGAFSMRFDAFEVRTTEAAPFLSKTCEISFLLTPNGETRIKSTRYSTMISGRVADGGFVDVVMRYTALGVVKAGQSASITPGNAASVVLSDLVEIPTTVPCHSPVKMSILYFISAERALTETDQSRVSVVDGGLTAELATEVCK